MGFAKFTTAIMAKDTLTKDMKNVLEEKIMFTKVDANYNVIAVGFEDENGNVIWSMKEEA